MKHNVSDNIYDPDASLAREQEPAAIISTLTLFVSDLTEASGRSAVISRSGNAT